MLEEGAEMGKGTDLWIKASVPFSLEHARGLCACLAALCIKSARTQRIIVQACLGSSENA